MDWLKEQFQTPKKSEFKILSTICKIDDNSSQKFIILTYGYKSHEFFCVRLI